MSEDLQREGRDLDRLAGVRSILCVPAHRPDRIKKARAAGAGRVLVDLEDGLPPEKREDLLAGELDLLPGEILRVPSASTRLPVPAGALVMLPKVEDAGTAREWIEELPGRVVPCFESPASLAVLRSLAPFLRSSAALAFGRVDFRACLPWRSSHLALEHAAAEVALAAAAAGVPSWDGPTMSLEEGRVQTGAVLSRRLGFTGQACVHPRQVSIVEEAFAVAMQGERSWAERVPNAAAVSRAGLEFYGPADHRAAVLAMEAR